MPALRRRHAAPRAGEHRGRVLTQTLGRRLVLLAALAGLVAIVATVALAPRTGTATGVVVAVDSTSLTEVTAFTIREAGGRTRQFAVGGLQNATEFPPGHLVEHIASGVPVIVTWRDEGGVESAIRIVDGPLPSGSGASGSPSPT
jgi:hypothetical protein